MAAYRLSRQVGGNYRDKVMDGRMDGWMDGWMDGRITKEEPSEDQW